VNQPAPHLEPKLGVPTLHVAVRLGGVVVGEQFIGPGSRAVRLGRHGELPLPVPRGAADLATVRPLARGAYEVVDGRGRRVVVSDRAPQTIQVAGFELLFEVVSRFPLLRSGESRWWEASPWLALVLAGQLLLAPGATFWPHRCEWVGGYDASVDHLLGCAPPQTLAGHLASTDRVAEFLQRVLAEDYAGSEHGTIERATREEATASHESFYLPAGGQGPATQMGGAEEHGLTEERSPEVESQRPDPSGGAPELLAVEGDDPARRIGVTGPDEGDGVTAVDPGVEEQEVEQDASEGIVEDKEGWGVQDWYDAEDQRREQYEIRVMTHYARERLAIDPNSLEALSILSYYQYLSEDFDAALATYDKYIVLATEDAAGYNNKALVYKRRGDYTTEESLYRVALALAPDDVTALNNLAVCLAHQGRHEEALSIMRRLEVLDPDDPYADLHRAKVYAELGDDARVYEYLEKALRGMQELDTLHHIEFRQDIRVDPSFETMRRDPTFRAILVKYYGKESPL
jgi:hypothetical protein